MLPTDLQLDISNDQKKLIIAEAKRRLCSLIICGVPFPSKDSMDVQLKNALDLAISTILEGAVLNPFSFIYINMNRS